MLSDRHAYFRDHYLNVPYDLSRVLFIATANLIDPIPRPLRDRMEIIRLPGYTPEEKVEIARSFLIPNQMREHGLPEDRNSLADLIAWNEANAAAAMPIFGQSIFPM